MLCDVWPGIFTMAATFRLRILTTQRGGEVHAMRW